MESLICEMQAQLNIFRFLQHCVFKYTCSFKISCECKYSKTLIGKLLLYLIQQIWILLFQVNLILHLDIFTYNVILDILNIQFKNHQFTANQNTYTNPTSTINSGDTSWVLASACLVLLMTPGLAIFYAGAGILRENTMYVAMCTLVPLVIVSIEWFIWGFSLSFSPSSNQLIGNLNNAFFIGMINPNSTYVLFPKIPQTTFAFFQMMFAAITPAITFSGATERIRVFPFVIYAFVWSTLVYNPVAYWGFSANGWFVRLGGFDTAGGMAVEIAAGFSSLALSLALGQRKYKSMGTTNGILYVIGGALLWFWWIGFNSGSLGAAGPRASNAALVTHLTACFGSLTWICCEFFASKKFSLIGLINGAVAGLVCVTPAAGFIAPYATPVLGSVGALSAWITTKWRHRFFDDSFDAFAQHGVVGFVGLLLTGIFGTTQVINLDGSKNLKGGWVNGNFIQLAVQLAGATAAAAWSFAVTLIIILAMIWGAKLFGTSITTSNENIDEESIGDKAYSYLQPNNEFEDMHIHPCSRKHQAVQVVRGAVQNVVIQVGQEQRGE